MTTVEMIIGALALLGAGTVLGVVLTCCCVVSGREDERMEIGNIPLEEKEPE